MINPRSSFLTIMTVFFLIPMGLTASSITVFVSIPPQAYLVDQIGGEFVRTELMVRPGQDPHTFEPTPKQMMTLAEAAVYFRIGLPFEERILPKIMSNLQSLKVIDCRHGITLLSGSECDHSHAHQHEQEAEQDLHYWLSPKNLKILAITIHDALRSVLPGDTHPDMEFRFKSLLQRLDECDASIKQSLEGMSGKSIFVFHPAFGYFCSEYGLKQISVETDGKLPGPQHIDRLITLAQAEKIRVVFVQPQFDIKSAEAIAHAIDGKVVPMDPLAYQIIDSLIAIRDAIVQSYSPGNSGSK